MFLQAYFIQYVWHLIIRQIVSNVGENVGTIWKKWPGFNDEHNMDHEYFGLEGELYIRKCDLTIPQEVVPKRLSCHLVQANMKLKLNSESVYDTFHTSFSLGSFARLRKAN